MSNREAKRILIRTKRLVVALVVLGIVGALVGATDGALAGVTIFGITVLMVLVVPLLRLRIRVGSRTTFGAAPGKPLRSAPPEVDDALPKLVWVLRNREPERVRAVLMDGPLLGRDNVDATSPLATSLSATLVHTAVGSDPAELAIATLSGYIADVAATLPIHVAERICATGRSNCGAARLRFDSRSNSTSPSHTWPQSQPSVLELPPWPA